MKRVRRGDLTEEQTDKWRDGHTDRWMNGQRDIQTDKWRDGHTYRWMNGQRDGRRINTQIDRWTNTL